MIIKDEQKTINYFGVKLGMSSGYPYVATDKNGEVWAHSDDPYLGNLEQLSDRRAVFLCKVELDGMDWRDTLMEV